MLIFDNPDTMRQWSRSQSTAGKKIGFVPTMGALHRGHAELIRVAAEECDTVVVSIFVNPTQFNVAEDFDKYPRTLDSDLTVATDAGATAFYVPDASRMYPEGFETYVVPGHTADPMEGAGRPGHFRGVTTIVTKLFNTVEPHVAYFGEKDFQQLAVITKMTKDLDIGVRIRPVPTVREHDGLALSSRNVRLTPEHRSQAPIIHQALSAAAEQLLAGRSVGDALNVARNLMDSIAACRVEYIDAVDSLTLDPADVNHESGTIVVATAAWFGDVRLIDNVRVDMTGA